MSGLKTSRVLIVTRNMPPLVGGMERLNWHMAAEVSKVAEVRLIGPRGSAALAPPGVRTYEVPLAPVGTFLATVTYCAWRIAKSWKPDVIIAGSGVTAPSVWWAARGCDARTAVYAHGLDIAVNHRIYRSLWIPAISRMDSVIANSSPTAALCREIGVEAGRIAIAHPGVELPGPPNDSAGCPSSAKREAFRSEYHLGDRPILLSVGRLSARKGLREFVIEAMPKVVALHPDVVLLVLGEEPNNALHARAQSRESIQAAADAIGVGSSLRFLGNVTDAELSAAYYAADAHVFPVREIAGDPEGFGMVAVESAAHGLPTVAFGTGGVVDAISDGNSGYVVPPGDYSALASAVSEVLSNGRDLRTSCLDFAAKFAWPKFGERVSAILNLIALPSTSEPI